MNDHDQDDPHDHDNVVSAVDKFTGWHRKLLLTEDRKIRPCLANVLTALREAPEWKGVIRLDSFAHTMMLQLPPPWERGRETWAPRPWGDADVTLTAEWCQRNGLMVPSTLTGEAAIVVAEENTFHPVRDYLESVRSLWDGLEHIDTVLPAAFGVEPTPYAKAVFRATMIAAVARIMKPGCKADTVLILEGAQGARKSTAVNVLFSPWFSDDLADMGSKDSAMQARGVWCIELAELSSMNRGEVERVKAFITRRVDRFRPAYGKYVIEAPRSCIFIGTTNSESYLRDESGARRFWPVKCGNIDTNMLQSWRDRLWAEAVSLYDADEHWWLTDTDTIEAAQAEQDSRFVTDPWEVLVQQAVALKEQVTIEDLLSEPLAVEKARQTTADLMRVGRILKRMGWRKVRHSKGGSRGYAYIAPVLAALPA